MYSVSSRAAAAAPLFHRAFVLWAALLCGLLALAQPARAQTIITTNTTINSPSDDLKVTGSPTVNLVSGGSVPGYLLAFDTSTVNMSGGSIGGFLDANNFSTVNVSGGSIGANLTAFDSSTVNVSGGSVGGFLFAQNSSTINLSGGSVGWFLGLYGTGTTLNVYGTGLSLTAPSKDVYGNTYSTLSGTLADGTPINKSVYLYNGLYNGLYKGADISQVILHETNPFVALKAQVQALADAGTLNKGNANALLVKLTAAQTALANGDTAGERDALTAFVNQVKAFVRTGKLTSAQGSALTSAAQAILNSLG